MIITRIQVLLRWLSVLMLLAVVAIGKSSLAQEATAPEDDGMSVPEIEPPQKNARKPSSQKKSHFVEIQSDFPEEELGLVPAGAGAVEPAP